MKVTNISRKIPDLHCDGWIMHREGKFITSSLKHDSDTILCRKKRTVSTTSIAHFAFHPICMVSYRRLHGAQYASVSIHYVSLEMLIDLV